MCTCCLMWWWLCSWVCPWRWCTGGGGCCFSMWQECWLAPLQPPCLIQRLVYASLVFSFSLHGFCLSFTFLMPWLVSLYFRGLFLSCLICFSLSLFYSSHQRVSISFLCFQFFLLYLFTLYYLFILCLLIKGLVPVFCVLLPFLFSVYFILMFSVLFLYLFT